MIDIAIGDTAATIERATKETVYMTIDGAARSVSWDDLADAARQGGELGAAYAAILDRATAWAVVVATDRRMARKQRCYGHAPSQSAMGAYEPTFFGSAESDRRNPAAHGAATEFQWCRCGAQRMIARNNGHEEIGDWGLPRLESFRDALPYLDE